MSELLNFILDHEEAFKSRGRLASLYSDFQLQASTNPDGYNANIAAWKRALVNAVRAGVVPSQGATSDLLSIRTGADLARELQSKQWGRPMALGAVIQDAVAKKELIPTSDFLTSKTSIYHKSWIITPWQVLEWGLRQVGLMGGGSAAAGDTLAVGNFVIVENVEVAANAVLKQLSSTSKSPVDLIYTPSTFLSEFGHILSPAHPLSQSDLTILLTHLSRDKLALSFTPTTIKFKPPTLPLTAAPPPVTEADTTIANLRALIAAHEAQIPLLTARIAQLDAAARAAVASRSPSSMTTARAALRSRKMAEQALVRRQAALGQLEEVFARMEAARENVEMVRAMEESAGVLRRLNREVGGVEGVERVVERLRGEMERVDEVSAVVNEVGAEGAAGAVDEGEVEEEFEALERAEREKREAEERREREENERKERAEWEAREKEEAEKTRKRLEELESLERQRKELDSEAHKQQQQQSAGSDSKAAATAPLTTTSSEEPELESSIQQLRHMSLDDPNSKSGERQGEEQPEAKENREPVPAS